MSAPIFDAYNQRTQFPHSYIKIADLDASTGATLPATSGGLSHVVISNANAAAASQTVTFLAGFDAVTEVYQVTVLANTTAVVYTGIDFGHSITDGLFVQNSADVTGVHLTAFFYS